MAFFTGMSMNGLGGAIPGLVQQYEPPRRRGGFFGQGGAGRGIAGHLGDALLQMSGMRPIYGPQQAQQQEMQQRMRLAEMAREQNMQDYLFQQKFERENAPPPNNDTINDFNFIRQQLGEDAARQYLQRQANPPVAIDVQQPDGSVRREWVTPPPAGGAPQGRPRTLTDEQMRALENRQNQGGPRPTASANFPAFRQTFQHGSLTSGTRTPFGNQLVGGVPNSAHLRGDAADYDGPNLPALRDEVQAYYGPNARVGIHRNHVHATMPGYGQVPLFGRRGTRRR